MDQLGGSNIDGITRKHRKLQPRHHDYQNIEHSYELGETSSGNGSNLKLNGQISKSWLMKTRPFHFKPENQRWPKRTAEKNRKNLSWNSARPNFTQFNSRGLEHRRLEVIGQYILSIRRIQPALKAWCRLLSQALVMRQIPGQQRPAAGFNWG